MPSLEPSFAINPDFTTASVGGRYLSLARTVFPPPLDTCRILKDTMELGSKVNANSLGYGDRLHRRSLGRMERTP